MKRKRGTKRSHPKKERRREMWNSWIWSQPEDHPQRAMAQPRWRRRIWARGKTEEHRRLHWLSVSAPGRLVKVFFHGLMRCSGTL